MSALTDRDDEVRAEQLRLVLGGIAQSVGTGIAVSTLMVAVLWPFASHTLLLGWYAVFLAERIPAAIFSYRALKAPRDPARDRRIERVLFCSKVVEGCIYGSLLRVGLPLEQPAVSILLISLMSALCGNGVSLLAPRRHLYLALAVPIGTLTAANTWVMGGFAYHVLAVFSILYVAGQYGQVVLASNRVRESIELRFENATLVEQLRAETAVAQRAHRDAEHANAAKSKFLAAASHDLRQPIHALGLFLQALSQTGLTSHQRGMLQSAEAANVASTDMLNTLLDFSRIEAGVVAPRLTALELHPLLDRIENDLAHLADAKQLIYRSPQTDLTVVSDAALLELILRNFVLNAIRYTDRGGVLIGCRRRGTDVSIEVYDTGIGIPDDQREEIFREFHQLGNPERDRRKGLGLGLAIARGLATSLDHPISLSSRVDRGSVFRILVPKAVEALRSKTDDDRPSFLSTAGGLAGTRVLIVEDDAAVRAAMIALLAGWGCQSWAVEAPGEAISRLRDEPAPDALICDYRLRGSLTGAEAIVMLRRHWDWPIPAVMITGDTAPARIREALDSGVPLLHKPVRPEALHQVLLTLISGKASSPSKSV